MWFQKTCFCGVKYKEVLLERIGGREQKGCKATRLGDSALIWSMNGEGKLGQYVFYRPSLSR